MRPCYDIGSLRHTHLRGFGPPAKPGFPMSKKTIERPTTSCANAQMRNSHTPLITVQWVRPPLPGAPNEVDARCPHLGDQHDPR